jgi:S-adenosylmethionine:tRNA ribosyltransferase-isomerase
MFLSDFDYHLPAELIAQEPACPRSSSRLLVLNKADGAIEHRSFSDLPEFLLPGDLLVANDTKVMRARLLGHKYPGGGAAEVFLLRELTDGNWTCLVRGRGIVLGRFIDFSGNLRAEIVGLGEAGIRTVRFNLTGPALRQALVACGRVPLPPYIGRADERVDDYDDYQTCFADSGKEKSSAAPTAGLHFTPELLETVRNKGVDVVSVTLHVGLGTFAPVKADDISQHKMHSEVFEINRSVAKKVLAAKQEGRRVIAIGTTSARVLEGGLARHGAVELPEALQGETDIFIYPGYEFVYVNALITNFHLPKSTLMMLISALAGREKVMEAYRQAVESKYRFFSFGDAMLIK